MSESALRALQDPGGGGVPMLRKGRPRSGTGVHAESWQAVGFEERHGDSAKAAEHVSRGRFAKRRRGMTLIKLLALLVVFFVLAFILYAPFMPACGGPFDFL